MLHDLNGAFKYYIENCDRLYYDKPVLSYRLEIGYDYLYEKFNYGLIAYLEFGAAHAEYCTNDLDKFINYLTKGAEFVRHKERILQLR
jgi:hypothetical protein